LAKPGLTGYLDGGGSSSGFLRRCLGVCLSTPLLSAVDIRVRLGKHSIGIVILLMLSFTKKNLFSSVKKKLISGPLDSTKDIIRDAGYVCQAVNVS
jgi:hypothetical protein